MNASDTPFDDTTSDSSREHDARRDIVVTAALPYANADLHLGHMVEATMTDIWVRFQRLRGHQCRWIWASDTHGTPIMLRAQDEGITPEALIERVGDAHRRDYQGFLCDYDIFYTTHSDENRDCAQTIYKRLREAGHIQERKIEQLYDPQKQMFLPDRYVKGVCPNCNAADQYGDNCEVCAATYDATELKNPLSVVSGEKPELRESLQYFFHMAPFKAQLQDWLQHAVPQEELRNKIEEWFDGDLQDWDISRNAPYFGFEIPDAPGKYFYVWMDAPIGYMSSHLHYCTQQHTLAQWEAAWAPGSRTELHHIIGKDIVRFHTMLWPATLSGAGYRVPTSVRAHGFLTVNGAKMSKSRGTFIKARTYLEHFDAEYLRYYFAAKLNGGVDDIDLNLEDLVARCNSDLVGKVVNIASRCASFLSRHFDAQLAESLPEPTLYAQFTDEADAIAEHYEHYQFAQAVRRIMALADLANQYIADAEPWVLAKDPQRQPEVQGICTQGVNLFRVIAIYLQPILPKLADKAAAYFGESAFQWEDIFQARLGGTVQAFKPMLTRLDTKQTQALLDATKLDLEEEAKITGSAAAPTAAAPTPAPAYAPIAPTIEYDDFAKLDLRVARVISAEAVEGSKKLLRFELDLGHETRTVFSGIRTAYDPETLAGRHVIMVANLAPRKMRFGLSEGMILSAGDEDIYLLGADDGAQAGMQVL